MFDVFHCLCVLNLNQPTEVDMVCASMNTSLGSMGGFSAGKSFIIDHQRLSGLGYCFSASLPPLLATSAMEALAIMDASPQLFEQLRGNARRMRELLDGWVLGVLLH